MRINRAQNDCATLLVVPISWGMFELERLVQIMFEKMNVPQLYIADAPLMAAYGCGVLSALVVDMGHETTDIAPVIDCIVQRTAAETIAIGGVHVRKYLKKLLEADKMFINDYGSSTVDEKFLTALIESDLCELKPFKEMTLPPLVNGIKRVEFTYGSKTVTIGSARFKAFEVLFDPSLSGSSQIGIPDLIYLSITASTDNLEKRLLLWDSILLTGGLSAVRGLRERLENELARLLAASETSSEFQPKEVKFTKTPEYFLNFKDRPSDAAYLGGTIVGR
ncbi:Actin-like protein 8, partial [Blyttiomyces sp. JEL0837]